VVQVVEHAGAEAQTIYTGGVMDGNAAVTVQVLANLMLAAATKAEKGAQLSDPRLVEIILRYDRMRRVEERDRLQHASGSVNLGVQAIEDIGHLLRLLGVALPGI
jgi:hypothetical protein